MNTASTEDFPALERRSRRGEPTWEIASLFPLQGDWSEAEYLALDTNHFVELLDGCLEFLALPTIFHQWLVQFLLKALQDYERTHPPGLAVFGPLPVRLWPGKFREPDLVYLWPERVRDRRKPPEGADLVMEVVGDSPEDRKRDLMTKREDYARAGIFEYWIIDPREHRITVLTLKGTAYVVHGEFTPGMQATSVLLPGFSVDVTAAFAAGAGPQEAAGNNQTK